MSHYNNNLWHINVPDSSEGSNTDSKRESTNNSRDAMGGSTSRCRSENRVSMFVKEYRK
jgi:hypothetical protein